MQITTTKNKTFNFTYHSIEQMEKRGLSGLNLVDVLSRSKTLQDGNSHKFGQALQRVYNNKKTSEPYTQIIVNTYYDIQFRVDSRDNTVLTVCRLSTQY